MAIKSQSTAPATHQQVKHGFRMSIFVKVESLKPETNGHTLVVKVDELRDAVLLVFANKQDLPNAMNVVEITDKLGLHSLRQCHWYI